MNPTTSKKNLSLWQNSRLDTLGSLHNLPTSKPPLRFQNFLGSDQNSRTPSSQALLHNLNRHSELKNYRISDHKFNLRRKSIVKQTPATLRETMEQVRARKASHDFTSRASKTRLKLFMDDDNSGELDDQINFLKENVIDRLVGIS